MHLEASVESTLSTTAVILVRFTSEETCFCFHVQYWALGTDNFFMGCFWWDFQKPCSSPGDFYNRRTSENQLLISSAEERHHQLKSALPSGSISPITGCTSSVQKETFLQWNPIFSWVCLHPSVQYVVKQRPAEGLSKVTFCNEDIFRRCSLNTVQYGKSKLQWKM